MPAYRTVVVADDFSEHAAVALAAAIELVQAFGGRLHLAHVTQRPVELLSPYEIALPASIAEDLRRAAERRLERSAAKARAAGIEVERHVREGSPAEGLAALCRELDADLLVLGTRGLTGLKHILLGSVAERALRLAPCAVLAVKRPEDA